MRPFTYTLKLTSGKDDGGYVVTCCDFPEAITQGDTREKALAEAADCLEEAIAARIDDGRNIPSPSAPKRGERTLTSHCYRPQAPYSTTTVTIIRG